MICHHEREETDLFSASSKALAVGTGFLFCNIAHYVCRYHLSLLDIPHGAKGKETDTDMLILMLLARL